MHPDLVLFCLPHAGGGASAFRGWAEALAPRVRARVLQLPGRETRLREPPVTTLEAACDDLVMQVGALADQRFALLGHSLGGLLALELAQRLRLRGREPEHLFVSACNAPGVPQVRSPIAQLPDGDFIDEVDRRYGGIPAVIRQDREFMAALTPSLRADFAILEAYRPSGAGPLHCPLTVFHGRDDHLVDAASLDRWRRHTTGRFVQTAIEGTHFYLQPQRATLVRNISNLLISASAFDKSFSE